MILYRVIGLRGQSDRCLAAQYKQQIFLHERIELILFKTFIAKVSKQAE
ncbi:hypothetical protein MHIR_DE00365 [Candidatus Doolittlea endobia]|uniref:Uncharacterized protein n=1 Tax=Candidatus Doolittlea endobia TaxID=1778262 RepID=A0A143WSA9_9ENTR|nr:hypothetical protein MHIR_DE00365 [Candidatus Doolittlea endobia]